MGKVRLIGSLWLLWRAQDRLPDLSLSLHGHSLREPVEQDPGVLQAQVNLSRYRVHRTGRVHYAVCAREHEPLGLVLVANIAGVSLVVGHLKVSLSPAGFEA